MCKFLVPSESIGRCKWVLAETVDKMLIDHPILSILVREMEIYIKEDAPHSVSELK